MEDRKSWSSGPLRSACCNQQHLEMKAALGDRKVCQYLLGSLLGIIWTHSLFWNVLSIHAL